MKVGLARRGKPVGPLFHDWKGLKGLKRGGLGPATEPSWGPPVGQAGQTQDGGRGCRTPTPKNASKASTRDGEGEDRRTSPKKRRCRGGMEDIP